MSGRMKTVEERKAGIDRLCKALGTTMGYVCDPLMSMLGCPSVNPIFIEEWLVKHGKGPADGESIRDALVKHYGEKVAALAESLI